MKKIFLCLMLCLCTVGCSPYIEKNDQKEMIRVGWIKNYSLYDEESIFKNYFQWIELEHPHVRIELIALKDMKDLEKNPVDIILTSPQEFKESTSLDFLHCLDSYVQTERELFSNYAPSVLKKLRAFGNGKLYMLTPHFRPSALAYNKKIFRESGVNFPVDRMTWDQVFTIAEKVSQKNIYGLSLRLDSGRHIAYEIKDFLEPLNMPLYDKRSEKMNVTSPTWGKKITRLTNLLKNRVIDPGNRSTHSYCLNDDKVAMVILDTLNFKLTDFSSSKWGLISMPEHIEALNASVKSTVEHIFGIDVRSKKTSLSWDIIKFIHGEKWARISQNEYLHTYLPEFKKSLYYHPSYEKAYPIIYTEASETVNDIWSKLEDVIDAIVLKNQDVKEQLKSWEVYGNELLSRKEVNHEK